MTVDGCFNLNPNYRVVALPKMIFLVCVIVYLGFATVYNRVMQIFEKCRNIEIVLFFHRRTEWWCNWVSTPP